MTRKFQMLTKIKKIKFSKTKEEFKYSRGKLCNFKITCT